MLLLLDLDNTLVDRDRAFSRWAEPFVAQHRGDRTDLEWLLETDAHGYTHRAVLADGLIDRLGLATTRDDLVQTLLLDHVPFVRCYDGVMDRLRDLRSAGHTLVILTNGTVEQQTRKVELNGLDAATDRVVISQAVGVKKPAPEIFAVAVQGFSTDRVPWIVGDQAEACIAGGRSAGLRTGWVDHGRDWTGGERPTASAPTTVEVLDLIAELDGADHA
ncbi:HAD family hydrolase [Brachybacterium sacelli]|uniref:Hydrolase of the HAD superfamily n=1 Tax=Brachybacterium sacelli TaxID=173364 RepID=A0ABS4WX31_9MICO|nr:HAD family hydrolase [Brachybacterium sacelli]MBP2380716.1 putative hydrolase of the HAD superfamily [Brachybacterium sacelli]